MRILFVTDARSPISKNWMRYFAERGDEIYIASTFFCDVDFPVKRLDFTPVAFSAIKKQSAPPGAASSRTLGIRHKLRQLLGPLTIPRSAQKLRALIREVDPDMIHAMRVPYEGMLTAQALSGMDETKPPFLVSIWGNDFTLHAPSTPLMGYYTRLTMKTVNALHADVERDIHLARRWGLGEEKATLVAPGSGGIRSGVFYPPEIPVEAPIILNPRGFRGYVRNDSFFKSIPLVLKERPDARFICSSMAGEPQAVQWIKELKIEHAVELMPLIPHIEMGNIFRKAQIVISPSVHDGSPNSLLEAMSCGCFPIAGDLDSIREWIANGENGLLIDPNDPQAIAGAILSALKDKDLRKKASGLNANLIAAKAGYEMNMERAGEFYKTVIGNW